MSAESIEFCFPNLKSRGYRITSPATPAYNCIAWAANDTQNWWWPVALGGYFWPAGSPFSATVADFTETFSQVGYELSESETWEQGFEKLAIYADENGDPTHIARQLNSGTWTSKLGESEDIEHSDLADLEGDCYGRAVRILKRRWSNRSV